MFLQVLYDPPIRWFVHYLTRRHGYTEQKLCDSRIFSLDKTFLLIFIATLLSLTIPEHILSWAFSITTSTQPPRIGTAAVVLQHYFSTCEALFHIQRLETSASNSTLTLMILWCRDIRKLPARSLQFSEVTPA